MSSPKFFEEIVKYCKSKKVPLILASTGHSEEQIDILRELSQIVPIMHAPNLSVGINLVKKILNFYPLDDLANSIEIIETHHKNKLDSPSGTAIELRNLIESKNSVNNFNPHYKINVTISKELASLLNCSTKISMIQLTKYIVSYMKGNDNNISLLKKELKISDSKDISFYNLQKVIEKNIN